MRSTVAVSEARAAILGRLRAAERTGRVPAVKRDIVIPPPARLDGDALLQRFVNELTMLGVDTHVEASAADVRARVRTIVGDRRVFSWDADALPFDLATVLPVAAHGTSPRDEQARAEIGVTGCDAAIAETGSIVLLAANGRPRAASLLPPVHLAIVRRGDLRFSMGDYFGDRADAIASASSCIVVSGPSRTADIELTLTVGVHGPGKVIVVIGP
jgi:L-lactate dehydrogenase complex protein LldG